MCWKTSGRQALRAVLLQVLDRLDERIRLGHRVVQGAPGDVVGQDHRQVEGSTRGVSRARVPICWLATRMATRVEGSAQGCRWGLRR